MPSATTNFLLVKAGLHKALDIFRLFLSVFILQEGPEQESWFIKDETCQQVKVTPFTFIVQASQTNKK